MLHLLHHLLHPLKVLWSERIELFWPIWSAMTAIGVIMAIWVVPEKKSVPLDSIRSRRHNWSPTAIIAVAFLSLFLACYIAGSLVWEDFTDYDNSHFTNGTLAGQDIHIQIAPEAGRFFPLALQEFSLVRHVTSSVTGYHAVPIVLLLLLTGILLVFDEELSIKARVALITLALITPSILISFNGLMYLERNVIFCLVCLAWFANRFEQTRSTAWAVAAVISSQFMLYYKETAFLLLLGSAGGRLLLRSRVPAKITSCIFTPRRERADCSPSTHEIASEILDLPQPLGPTMAAMPSPWNFSSVRSQKDLNPRICSFFNLSNLYSLFHPLLQSTCDGEHLYLCTTP